MQYALDHNITLPVNYYSFVFKNQFQAAGVRRRSAEMMKTGYEDVTKSLSGGWVLLVRPKILRKTSDPPGAQRL
ncbi:MAG: hypothetical protein R2860_14285 [Desulfobacterales bacterium]